jgi:hypothetical protein
MHVHAGLVRFLQPQVGRGRGEYGPGLGVVLIENSRRRLVGSRRRGDIRVDRLRRASLRARPQLAPCQPPASEDGDARGEDDGQRRRETGEAATAQPVPGRPPWQGFRGDAFTNPRLEMLPEERRRLRDVEPHRLPQRGANRLGLRAARLAGLGMRGARGRERVFRQIDEFRQGEMIHRSNFFRLFSAWKKFAFTAPTELPRMPAISSCGSS